MSRTETRAKAAAVRRYTSSSSFKMALFFSIQLGLGVIVLGYFGYYFARGHFVHGTEEIIDTELRYLSRMEASALASALENPPPQRLYMLLDEGGSYAGGNLRALPAAPQVLAEGSLLFEGGDGRDYAARIHTFADGRRLLAGVDVTDVAQSYALMLWLSLLSIALMLVVIVTSFFISTFVVSRTSRIAATAKEIMDTGNLSQRIVIDSKWDDMSYLSGVLNAFLSRMEELVTGIQRVSDNIAHDLRTPLTRLRNNLEAMRHHDSAKGDELMAEADHLLATFNAILRISRIETARQKNNFAPVALSPLLCDVADLYEPIAEQKGVALTLNLQEAEVTGDRDLLFQAFANLLDNALKFTPAGGRVSLTLRKEGARAVCSVADSGPGIPAHERDKVFSRFYRGDSSRNTPGSGLGLSLVAAVASLHDAEISLADQGSGLRVILTI